MTAHVRPYAPSDAAALDDVCVRTGWQGSDASTRYADPLLLAEIWLRPYLTFAPDLAWVLDDGAGSAVGYVVGVASTARFEAWCDDAWWPDARLRHPRGAAGADGPDAGLVHLLHDPPRTPADVLDAYPAHLHVDLLPPWQRRGHGRALLDRFRDALRERGVPGVHLGVGAGNPGARTFYERLGFAVLDADEHGALMGQRLG